MDMGNGVVCLEVYAARLEGLRQNRMPNREPRIDRLGEFCVGTERRHTAADVKETVLLGAIEFTSASPLPEENCFADFRWLLKPASKVARRMTDQMCSSGRQGHRAQQHSAGRHGRKGEAIVAAELARRGVEGRFAALSNFEPPAAVLRSRASSFRIE